MAAGSPSGGHGAEAPVLCRRLRAPAPAPVSVLWRLLRGILTVFPAIQPPLLHWKSQGRYSHFRPVLCESCCTQATLCAQTALATLCMAYNDPRRVKWHGTVLCVCVRVGSAMPGRRACFMGSLPRASEPAAAGTVLPVVWEPAGAVPWRTAHPLAACCRDTSSLSCASSSGG